MVLYFESYREITSPLWWCATYDHSSQLVNEFYYLIRLHIMPVQKLGFIYHLVYIHNYSFIHDLYIFQKCIWSTLHGQPLSCWKWTSRGWRVHEHWALRPRFLTIPHIFSLQFLSVQQLRSGGNIMSPAMLSSHQQFCAYRSKINK